MNKILSWKITGGVYAYIYPVVDNKYYISNRIPENSPIWEEVINTISKWDESKYKSNFDKMAAEVQTKYGYSIEYDSKFFGFVDENAVDGVNIVLLAGKDGEGIGGGGIGGGDGDGFGNGSGAEIIEEFEKKIQSKLDAVKDDIEKQNKEVEIFVENKVSETLSKAESTINDTKKELNDVREGLEKNLELARDALDKAANLFNTAEGGIDPEAIKNALSSVQEYGNWMETYSGDITTLKTDYDAANQKMGSIGEVENVTDGLFSRFATSLSVVSGTVGNVESWMVASAATIGNMASWYDSIESSATEAISFINASSGIISDVISYIDSDEFGNEITTKLERSMCAHTAEIVDRILNETDSAITNVTSIMNGLSGVVETNITRMDTISDNLTTMGDKMDAMAGTMEEYMTKFNEVSGIAIDLRDSWSAESGKLSTVASLVAETDAEGNIRYFVSSATVNGKEEILANEIEVRKIINDDGTHYFKPLEGQGGTLSNHIWTEAYMKMSQEMGSYIQQGVSSITMSVVGGENLTSAIKLAISGDSALISLIAKEVVIDATAIIKEIQSIKGVIGGIVMEEGCCYSSATDSSGNPMFKLDGKNGTIYADNAVIKGEVHSSKGNIGGFEMEDGQMKSKATDSNDKPLLTLDGTNGIINAQKGIFKGAIYYPFLQPKLESDRHQLTIDTPNIYVTAGYYANENILVLPKLIPEIDGFTFRFVFETFTSRMGGPVTIQTYDGDVMIGPSFPIYNTYTSSYRYTRGMAQINRLKVERETIAVIELTAMPPFYDGGIMRWFITDIKGYASNIGGLGPNDKYLMKRKDSANGLVYKEYESSSTSFSPSKREYDEGPYDMSEYDYDLSLWRTPEFIL